MALMKCPECGLQVSDKALSCPHCGYPLDSAVKKKKGRGPRQNGNGFRTASAASQK